MGEKVQNKAIYRVDELPDLVAFESEILNKVIVVPKQTVALFLSEGIYAVNPYWRYSGLLNEEEILALIDSFRKAGLDMECKLDQNLIKKVGRYIVIYAENLQLLNFLSVSEASIAKNDEGKMVAEFLAEAIPFLYALRKLYRKLLAEPEPDILFEMIDFCLKNGIDPFWGEEKWNMRTTSMKKIQK